MKSKEEENTTNPHRDVPAENGRNSNHNYRDESDIPTSINTVRTNEYADDNQKITETAVDDFRKKIDSHPNADRSFDEPEKE